MSSSVRDTLRVDDVGTDTLRVSSIRVSGGWLSVSDSELVVPPGSRRTVLVVMDAAGLYAGEYRDTVWVESNDPSDPVVEVPVVLTVGAPSLAFEPSSVAEELALGATVTDSVYLYNTGSSDLSVSAVSSPESWVVGLDPAAVVVGLVPDSTYQGEVRVESDDPYHPDTSFAVSLHVVAPSLAFEPSSVSEELALGATATDSVYLYNTGSSDLSVSAVSSPESWVVGLDPAAVVVSPGDSALLKVGLSSAGLVPDSTYQGEVRVESDDPYHPDTSFVVSLHVVAPSLAFEPSSVSEELALGSTVTDSVYLYNTGSSDLSVSAVSSPESWVVGLDPAAVVVSPGDSALLKVTLSTEGMGPCSTYTGQVNISSDDPYHPDTSFVVSLHVVAPSLAYQPNEIAESVMEGESASDTILLRNTGSLRLDIDSVGTGASWIEFQFPPRPTLARPFAQGGILPVAPPKVRLEGGSGAGFSGRMPGGRSLGPIGPLFSIFPGESAAVVVGLNASGLEPDSTYAAEIAIRSNAYDHPDVSIPVSLEVTAIPLPDLDYHPKVFDWEVQCGGEGLDTLVVENKGSASLEVELSTAAPWLIPEPTSVSPIGPGGSTSVLLHYSAAELSSGSCADTLILASNDPDTPEAKIPVRLRVVCGSIEVTPDTLNVVVLPGAVYRDSVDIRNLGNGVLEVRVVVDSVAAQFVTFEDDSFAIPPGECASLHMIVDPSNLEGQNGTFEFFLSSNDVENPMVRVVVKVFCPVPLFRLTPPDSLRLEVSDSVELVDSVKVSNEGDGILDFGVTEHLDWLEFDPDTGLVAKGGEKWLKVLVDVGGTNWRDTTVVGTAVFHSNDPDDSVHVLVIELRVVGTAVDECRALFRSECLDRYRMKGGYFDVGLEFGSSAEARSVDPGSVRLFYHESSAGAVSGYSKFLDTDGDGVEEMWLRFSVDALNRMLEEVPSGQEVNVSVRGSRIGGGQFVGVARFQVRGLGREVSLRNYPNPFNPTTTIEYVVPTDSRVTLRIYDVSGRLVKTVVDGRLGASVYRYQWAGRNEAGREIAAGVYISRLEVGSKHISRKLLLLK